jgi:hypothetical protein
MQHSIFNHFFKPVGHVYYAAHVFCLVNIHLGIFISGVKRSHAIAGFCANASYYADIVRALCFKCGGEGEEDEGRKEYVSHSNSLSKLHIQLPANLQAILLKALKFQGL